MLGRLIDRMWGAGGGSKRDETSRLMIAGDDFITRFIY